MCLEVHEDFDGVVLIRIDLRVRRVRAIGLTIMFCEQIDVI